MKLIQANPKSNNKNTILKSLNDKELELRGGNTSFSKKGRYKWYHIKYQGWVTVTIAPNDILFAKVQAKSEAEEGKIFEAFVGYLTRHCGKYIDTLTIYYR